MFGNSSEHTTESAKFHRIPTAVWVGLADGSRCSITEMIAVVVTVRKPLEASLGPVNVSVLPNHERNSETCMLIGRDLGAALGLCLDLGAGVVRSAEKSADEPIVDNSDFVRYVDQLSATTAAQPRLVDACTTEYLTPSLPEDLSKKVKALINRSVAEGFFQEPTLPGYRLAFRNLSKEDKPDCVEQVAALFVDLPDTPIATAKSRLYALHAYKKLAEGQKSVYSKLIEAYVARGFWRPVSGDEVTSTRITLPPCPCFVTNWERKPRVVLDCRPVNQALGKVSSPRVIPWTLILAMRLQGDVVLLQGDCEAAFYKCRLLRHTVLIQAATGLFECLRVSFGLHFGPGSLTTGIHRIETSIRNVLTELWPLVNMVIRWYVDDLVMSADDVAIAVAGFAMVIYALLLLGFSAQMAKVAALVHSSVVNQFKEACRQYGVQLPVKERVEILGLTASFDDNHLVLDCNRQSRWSVVEAFLECRSPTKRLAFQAAGAAAYDVGQIHPIERLVSDCLRAIVGRAFSHLAWGTEYDIGKLSDHLREAYCAILDWLRELTPADKCMHRSLLRSCKSEPVRLILETDASLTGGGFSLWVGSDSAQVGDCGTFELGSAAWRWTARSSCWHSNRRELAALWRGILFTSTLLTAWISSQSSPDRAVLVIRTDNAACARWANDVKVSRALEARALQRLAAAIRAEIVLIKAHGVEVSMRHLPGVLNVRADRLSRALERKTRGGSQLGRLMQDHLDPPVRVAQELDDFVCRLGELPVAKRVDVPQFEPIGQPFDRVCQLQECDTPVETHSVGLADTVASRSWDVDCALHGWKTLRFAFQAWSGSVAIPLDYPTAYSDEDVWSFIRSLQRSSRAAVVDDAENRKLPTKFHVDKDGTLFYKCAGADGKLFLAFYVPSDCNFTRRLLARVYHKAGAHCSAQATVERAIEAGFFTPRLRQVVTNEMATCVRCQVLSSRREWAVTPGQAGGGPGFDLYRLALETPEPYLWVGIDVLSLGPFKCLTCVCLLTKHACWIALGGGQTAEELLEATERVARRQGGCRFRYIVCDGAVGSRTYTMEVGRRLNAQVVLQDPRAPWAGGFETHHRIGLKAARVLFHGYSRNCDWGNSVVAQDFCDEVCSIINSRPLTSGDVTQDARVVALTPNSLRFGYSLRGHQGVGLITPDLAGSSEAMDDAEKSAFVGRRAHLMRSFVNHYLPARRRAVFETLSGGSRPTQPFRVGDSVIIHQPSRKQDACWRTGWVVSCLSTHRYRVLHSSPRAGAERITIENHYNLHPLKLACEVHAGPTLVGARLRVLLSHADGFRDYHWGTILVDRSEDDRVLIVWDVADEGVSAREWLALSQETWDYGEGHVTPDDQP
ncbi:hypothetical protein Pmar_PMAR010102 [Perkinsus marinus ATCC 50983]|uniref:Integrase catalytic domain-containing protein n=1 Tax=Perkinsus marinus (strain ATCC 50983 / TXsc) TaxID=423536 RepID=C5K4U6_PERM5|nr:hypothetical protein Pmar_PMAR010102 [Perkinsus marinus ATCC 50983]EER20368.1 hypothetical protein Pmar_PMAR010102 [Perkinsus marinus ATCC 50983]|eukprot:XP_002788572.1 hypothetical protein Pmar_PMAR010102 [Perkinsus marinus ATCC 50983]